MDRPRGTTVVVKIPAGQTVTGVTGWVISKPRRHVATHDFEDSEIRKGDIYYVLHPIGEGFWAVWFKGKVVQVELEDQDGAQQDDSVWWAQIRTRDGKTGWTIVTDNFDDQDACG